MIATFWQYLPKKSYHCHSLTSYLFVAANTWPYSLFLFFALFIQQQKRSKTYEAHYCLRTLWLWRRPGGDQRTSEGPYRQLADADQKTLRPQSIRFWRGHRVTSSRRSALRGQCDRAGEERLPYRYRTGRLGTRSGATGARLGLPPVRWIAH